MVFFNQKRDTGKYYIVDGQQRLNTIKKFYKNELKLNGKFSGDDNHNKIFNGKNPISKEQRNLFLKYELREYMFEDYSDEEVRRVFCLLVFRLKNYYQSKGEYNRFKYISLFTV